MAISKGALIGWGTIAAVFGGIWIAARSQAPFKVGDRVRIFNVTSFQDGTVIGVTKSVGGVWLVNVRFDTGVEEMVLADDIRRISS